MAELLVQLANVRAGHVAGEVVTVKPDGFPWSEQNRRLFPIVKCTALGLRAAATIYLVNGIPPTVSRALSDADAALSAAVASGDADAISVAKSAVQAAKADADPTTWPPRARVLDVSALPSATRSRVLATWATRSSVRAQAEAQAQARFIDFLDRSRLGPLTAEEKTRSVNAWQDMLQRRYDSAQLSGADAATLGRLRDLIDRLAHESRLGFRGVEDAALAPLAVPSPIAVTLATLQAATLTIDATAYHAARS